jgi:hypothetical protein
MMRKFGVHSLVTPVFRVEGLIEGLSGGGTQERRESLPVHRGSGALHLYFRYDRTAEGS